MSDDTEFYEAVVKPYQDRIAELEARCAVMEDGYRSTIKAVLAVLPGQRDPHPDNVLQRLVNLARGLLEDNLEADLTDDGSKMLAVVDTARNVLDVWESRSGNGAAWTMATLSNHMRHLGQALADLDGKENNDG